MVTGVDFATKLFVALVTCVVLQRISELRLARHNESWARSQGAQEYGQRHYPLFFLLHGGWLVGWIFESSREKIELGALWGLWLFVFALAACLRYWSIISLGRRWNTRILVLEGVAPVRRGPYRVLAHPNYLAVALELLALPLVFGALVTAGITGVLNAALLLGVRIPVEQRALALASRSRDEPSSGV